MSIKIILATGTQYELRHCAVCNLNFKKGDKLISKDTSRSGKAIHYHIRCAREVNLIVSDMWWNRISKYKRFEWLISQSTMEDEAQELSQSSYSKLPEQVKLLVDIHFMESQK